MDRFAQTVMAFLDAEGETRPKAFRAESSSIMVGDGRALTHFVFLDALKRRVESAENRESGLRLLDRDLIAHRQIKSHTDLMARRLLPRLRPLATLKTFELRCRLLNRLHPEITPSSPIAHVGFNSALVTEFVVRLSSDAVEVTEEMVERWGEPVEGLMASALKNLAGCPLGRPVQLKDNLWVYSAPGSHAAARLIPGAVLPGFPPRDDLVAMAPNEHLLLFASRDDDEALASLASLGAENSQGSFGLWALTLERSGERWEPWLPEPERPSHSALKQAALPGLARLYGAHKEVLEGWHDVNRLPWAVSPLLVARDNSGLFSVALWQRGVPTLLPPADRVVVVDTSEQRPRAWSVPWAEVPALNATLERVGAEAGGDRLEVGVLEYWRVTGDPTLAALALYPRAQ